MGVTHGQPYCLHITLQRYRPSKQPIMTPTLPSGIGPIKDGVITYKTSLSSLLET